MPPCLQFVMNCLGEVNALTAGLGQGVLDSHEHPPGSCYSRGDASEKA